MMMEKPMTVQTSVRKVTKAVKKVVRGEAATKEDRDILDTLKQEHDEVKSLLSKLQDAEGASERKSLVKQIKQALVPHTKAEEKVVYDAIIALRDKKTQIDGEEGYIEHGLASKTLQQLEKCASATSAEHIALAKVLKELVGHHIEEEENNVWSDVEEHFSDEEREDMNRAFLAAKEKVRV
jgi:hemerythrin-like domain-containing protein